MQDHEARVRILADRQRLETATDKLNRYRELVVEEQKAVRLLERYIREAQDLVKKPEDSTPAAHHAAKPA